MYCKHFALTAFPFDLTPEPGFDDYPSLAFDADGELWASWVSLKLATM